MVHCFTWINEFWSLLFAQPAMEGVKSTECGAKDVKNDQVINRSVGNESPSEASFTSSSDRPLTPLRNIQNEKRSLPSDGIINEQEHCILVEDASTIGSSFYRDREEGEIKFVLGDYKAGEFASRSQRLPRKTSEYGHLTPGTFEYLKFQAMKSANSRDSPFEASRLRGSTYSGSNAQSRKVAHRRNRFVSAPLVAFN